MRVILMVGAFVDGLESPSFLNSRRGGCRATRLDSRTSVGSPFRKVGLTILWKGARK